MGTTQEIAAQDDAKVGNESAAATVDAGAPSSVRSPATAVATDLALIATFAALIAVCALLTGPAVNGVPLTLQTFAVLLAGVALGPWRGAAAVALYIGVGLAGLPIFAGGKAGVAVLAGPSVGYLLAFPLAALVAGLVVRFAARRGLRPLALHAGIGVTLGTLVIYAIGIPVLGARLGIDLSAAFVGNLAYVPGDAVKATLAVLVGLTVLRAYPQLVRR